MKLTAHARRVIPVCKYCSVQFCHVDSISGNLASTEPGIMGSGQFGLNFIQTITTLDNNGLEMGEDNLA